MSSSGQHLLLHRDFSSFSFITVITASIVPKVPQQKIVKNRQMCVTDSLLSSKCSCCCSCVFIATVYCVMMIVACNTEMKINAPNAKNSTLQICNSFHVKQQTTTEKKLVSFSFLRRTAHFLRVQFLFFRSYSLVWLNMVLCRSTRTDVDALGAAPSNHIVGRKQPFLFDFL